MVEANRGPEFSTVKQALIAEMVETGVVKFEGGYDLAFHATHPDADLAPILLDFPMLWKSPSSKDTAVRAFVEMIHNEVRYRPILLSCVPSRGMSFASPVQDALGEQTGLVTPRLVPKTYGVFPYVDGMLEEYIEKEVIVLDDFVASASSVLHAINRLNNEMLTAEDVFVLVDYGIGASDRLQEKGCKLHSYFSMEELLSYYVAEGKMTQGKSEEIVEKLSKIKSVLTRAAA